jgi:hypothetical protein
MNRAGFLTISIGLNVTLLAVVIYQHQVPTASPTPAPTVAVHGNSKNPRREPSSVQSPAFTSGTSGPAFDWKCVESDDYKVYIQQLRKIGCPEATIRDIITADVRKLYEAKRAELKPKGTRKYWEAGFAQGGARDRHHEESLRTLEQEEKQVLKELLGSGWDQAYRAYPASSEEAELEFGDLPGEKRDKIRSSLKKFSELEAALQERSLSGVLSEEDEQKLKELRLGQRQELAQILTPEELEQHDLRNSETAQNLRAGLVGLELSEQEFLNVYRWQKKLDELAENSTDPTDPKFLQTEKQVEDQIRKLLGEKRFAEFQLGNDPDYRDLYQLGKGYALPSETVRKVYDLQTQLEQAQETLVGNPDLTPEARDQALTELQRQADGAIKGLVGNKAFEVYQKRFGRR